MKCGPLLNIDAKECMFCGCEDLAIGCKAIGEVRYFFVQCEDCLASGPVALVKRDAIRHWNDRENP